MLSRKANGVGDNTEFRVRRLGERFAFEVQRATEVLSRRFDRESPTADGWLLSRADAFAQPSADVLQAKATNTETAVKAASFEAFSGRGT